MNNINLKQALELFLFDRETYCSAKTVYNYKCTLKYFSDFIESEFDTSSDHIMIQSITKLHIQKYVLMLRKRNKLSTHEFKPTVDSPVTNTTIRTYSIDIRTFFNFLINEEILENNPMKNFKLIKREKKAIIPMFEDEMKEIDKMFNLKCVSGLRNYCVVHLMLDAGLRTGDVCSLRVQDVDFVHNHIIVLNSKGDKDRIIPMAKILRTYVYKYINMFRPVTAGNDFLFISVDGQDNVLTENSIKSLFSRIRKKTGITRLKPHLLRHTFATSFILYGGNLESLRLYLGHTSYSTTQMYLHLASLYQRMDSKVYRVDQALTRPFLG